MIERTQEEAQKFFEGLWSGEIGKYEDAKITVRKTVDGWVVNAKRMYEYLPLNLALLMKIADFFGTLNIGDDKSHWGGCESCDYGSSYEIDLTIKEKA